VTRAKGKDLNGLSQKAFSYSPWPNDHGEMARERTYFKQISLFRVRCIYVAHKTSAVRPGCCMYTTSMLLERIRFFFLGGVSNFKRFKAISQEGGASDCRPSNTDRPMTLSFFLTPVPFLLFSLLFPTSVVTYCEFLKEQCCRKSCPFRCEKFRAT